MFISQPRPTPGCVVERCTARSIRCQGFFTVNDRRPHNATFRSTGFEGDIPVYRLKRCDIEATSERRIIGWVGHFEVPNLIDRNTMRT